MTQDELDEGIIASVYNDSLGMLKYFEAKGGNIRTLDDEPLSGAVLRGNYEMMLYLIDKGADISIFDEDTIAHAEAYDHLLIAKYLKEKLAEQKSSEKYEEITVKFGKGYVGEPFMAKDGRKFVEISIPNTDKNDTSFWKKFVLPEKSVHADKFNEKLSWTKIAVHSAITLSQSVKEADGTFSRSTEKVSAFELKALLDNVLPKKKEVNKEASKLAEIKGLGTHSEKDATKNAPIKNQER